MKNFLNKALAFILTAAFVLSLPAVAYADENEEQKKQQSYDEEPDTNALKEWPQGPKVYAEAAVVMDMDSGAVLYSKNADEKMYPASITKLLTALVAAENSDFTDSVEFSEDSIAFLRYGDAHIGMTPGEIISMDDAMHGLLLASANEVAYAIAENVGKKIGNGYDDFIRKMNERSEELGCVGSHWTNANGLHDSDHYTTAYDMALIASEVSKHSELLDIMQTLNYTMPETNLVDETRTFQQHHKMLWQGNRNYYEYCIGGKTGYTDDAGTTLVTMADNGRMRLAAVVLHDYGTDAYTDTREMFDYVYGNFSKMNLAEGRKPEQIKSYTDKDAYVVLPEGTGYEELEMDITVLDEKEAAGEITYLYQNQPVGTVKVTLTPEYVESATGYTTRLQISGAGRAEEQKDSTDTAFPLWGAVLIGAAAVLVLLTGLLFAAYLRRQRRRRRRRRRRRQQKYRGRERGKR